MKHFMCVLFIILLVLSGCSGSGSSDLDYGATYHEVPDGFDYTVSSGSNNSFLTANFVDGLMEYNDKGELVNALAGSVKSEENDTVWTFTIRKGAKWVTSSGEEYGEVTSDDWLVGLRHALDEKSDEAYLVRGIIKGAAEYMDGTGDFHSVGIEAVDRYTVKYTLEKPYYFPALTVHGILYPINREFFGTKSCALGGKNTELCKFGQIGKDGILYNGAYILSEYNEKGTIVLTKNPDYYDKNKVRHPTVTFLYDSLEDPHFAMKKFEDGETSYAAIRSDWFKDDYDSYMSKYNGYVLTAMPDDTLQYLRFVFERTYDGNSERSAEEAAAVRKALLNKNFRLAILSAFDRSAFVSPECGDKELGNLAIRNTIVAEEIKITGEQSYSAILLDKLKGSFLADKNLLNGKDAFYDPNMSRNYLELAKEEGVTLPVTLELPVSEDAQDVHRASTFKNSVETSTNGQILIRLVPEGQDADLSLSGIIRPAYNDPASYLENMPFEKIEDETVREALKIDVYTDLMKAASDAEDESVRNEKYAETEAWILSEALIVPVCASDAEHYVSRTDRIIHPEFKHGLSGYRLKYTQVTELLQKP